MINCVLTSLSAGCVDVMEKLKIMEEIGVLLILIVLLTRQTKQNREIIFS